MPCAHAHLFPRSGPPRGLCSRVAHPHAWISLSRAGKSPGERSARLDHRLKRSSDRQIRDPCVSQSSKDSLHSISLLMRFSNNLILPGEGAYQLLEVHS